MCSWLFCGVRMRLSGRLENDLRKSMDTNTPGDLVPSGVLVLAEGFAFLLKSGRFNLCLISYQMRFKIKDKINKYY